MQNEIEKLIRLLASEYTDRFKEEDPTEEDPIDDLGLSNIKIGHCKKAYEIVCKLDLISKLHLPEPGDTFDPKDGEGLRQVLQVFSDGESVTVVAADGDGEISQWRMAVEDIQFRPSILN